MNLDVTTMQWELREPFAISRGVKTEYRCILVTLRDAQGRTGRGEGCGVSYRGETAESMTAEIEAVRGAIERGVTRDQLRSLLPAGGARCAVDCALWDLEAKASGTTVFEMAKLAPARPLKTAYTIGIRSIDAYEASARQRAKYPFLKIKVDAADPVSAVAAVRRGSPGAAFIVDPNQSWSVAQLKDYAVELSAMGVVLLEQPIKVGDEAQLDGYDCPIKLCADELINEAGDLARAAGRFKVINIKLDKTGGLTTALRLAQIARSRGFELMVGCMEGSSLSMAPAFVLGQQCAFIDLDGPLLQASDWPGGLVYSDGVVHPPARHFWG